MLIKVCMLGAATFSMAPNHNVCKLKSKQPSFLNEKRTGNLISLVLVMNTHFIQAHADPSPAGKKEIPHARTVQPLTEKIAAENQNHTAVRDKEHNQKENEN